MIYSCMSMRTLSYCAGTRVPGEPYDYERWERVALLQSTAVQTVQYSLLCSLLSRFSAVADTGTQRAAARQPPRPRSTT